MPTEGWFSCLFSILKWAANDRPYIVNGGTNDRPYIVNGGTNDRPTSFAATPHYWNGSFFYKPTMYYYRRKVR